MTALAELFNGRLVGPHDGQVAPFITMGSGDADDRPLLD